MGIAPASRGENCSCLRRSKSTAFLPLWFWQGPHPLLTSISPSVEWAKVLHRVLQSLSKTTYIQFLEQRPAPSESCLVDENFCLRLSRICVYTGIICRNLLQDLEGLPCWPRTAPCPVLGSATGLSLHRNVDSSDHQSFCILSKFRNT